MEKRTVFVHPSMLADLADILVSDDTVEFVSMPELAPTEIARCAGGLMDYGNPELVNRHVSPPTPAKRWGNNKRSSVTSKAKRKIAKASKRKNRK